MAQTRLQPETRHCAAGRQLPAIRNRAAGSRRILWKTAWQGHLEAAAGLPRSLENPYHDPVFAEPEPAVKIGLYDPASLEIDGSRGSIAFISALDARDVVRIPIATRESLDRVRAGLAAQRDPDTPWISDAGPIEVRKGIFRMSGSGQDGAREGLIGVVTNPSGDGSRQISSVPFRARAALADVLPESGSAILRGVMADGVLEVVEAAAMPIPAPAAPEPASTEG